MMVDFAIIGRARRASVAGAVDPQGRACCGFRPIMMTTMAALLGGVPLMLGTGTGSEIRQPLGYAMVGGLIVGQALTLFHDAGGVSLSRPALRARLQAGDRSKGLEGEPPASEQDAVGSRPVS